MQILAPYSEHRALADRQETDAILAGLPGRFKVIRWNNVEDGDMVAGYVEHWGRESTLIVEHDLIFSESVLDELWGCPEPLCAWAYALHFDDGDRIAHRKAIPAGSVNHGYAPVDWNAEYADAFGMGLLKITKEIQQLVDLRTLDPHWMFFDHRLSVEYQKLGIQAHLHWPLMPHKHTYS